MSTPNTPAGLRLPDMPQSARAALVALTLGLTTGCASHFVPTQELLEKQKEADARKAAVAEPTIHPAEVEPRTDTMLQILGGKHMEYARTRWTARMQALATARMRAATTQPNPAEHLTDIPMINPCNIRSKEEDHSTRLTGSGLSHLPECYDPPSTDANPLAHMVSIMAPDADEPFGINNFTIHFDQTSLRPRLSQLLDFSNKPYQLFPYVYPVTQDTHFSAEVAASPACPGTSSVTWHGHTFPVLSALPPDGQPHALCRSGRVHIGVSRRFDALELQAYKELVHFDTQVMRSAVAQELIADRCSTEQDPDGTPAYDAGAQFLGHAAAALTFAIPDSGTSSHLPAAPHMYTAVATLPYRTFTHMQCHQPAAARQTREVHMHLQTEECASQPGDSNSWTIALPNKLPVEADDGIGSQMYQRAELSRMSDILRYMLKHGITTWEALQLPNGIKYALQPVPAQGQESYYDRLPSNAPHHLPDLWGNNPNRCTELAQLNHIDAPAEVLGEHMVTCDTLPAQLAATDPGRAAYYHTLKETKGKKTPYPLRFTIIVQPNGDLTIKKIDYTTAFTMVRDTLSTALSPSSPAQSVR